MDIQEIKEHRVESAIVILKKKEDEEEVEASSVVEK